MKKTFAFLALLCCAAAFGETSKFTFEDNSGSIDGQDGWTASGNVRVVESMAVSSTNDILVSAWHAYGAKALEMEGSSSLSRSVSISAGSEQRLAFDFYAAWPDEENTRSLVLKLGDVPILKLESGGTNVVSALVFGHYFGGEAEWQPVPGVQTLFHRKWQHIEVLFDRDHLLKLKAPNMDAELVGFAFSGQIPAAETTFSAESDFEKIYLDNFRFLEEPAAHETLIDDRAGADLGLGQSYETSFATKTSFGGLELSCALNIPANCMGFITLNGFPVPLSELPLSAGENVISLGFLKDSRLVKAQVNGADVDASALSLTLPDTVNIKITSLSTGSLKVKGVFAQNSLPVVYGETASIDLLMVAYTGGGNNTPPENYTNLYYPKVQDFYFRNSNAQLLLKYDPVYRHIIPPAETFFRDYENEFGEKEVGGRIMARDLRKTLGVWNQEYDLFVFTCGNGWNSWGGNWGGGSYGYTGMGMIMCSQVGNYGGSGTGFVTVHEVMHSVDQMYSYSGFQEYSSSHPDGCSYGWAGGGDTWSWCGTAMRPFTNYFKLRTPWKSTYVFRDSDLDGLADNDPVLPIDEVRMSSDPTKTDTDMDGLDDLKEYLVGLYYPSDANDPDTDKDGLKDGDDPYPIIPYNKSIPRLLVEPTIDGFIEEGEWTYWGSGTGDSEDPEFEVTAYAGWRDDALYLAFKTNKKCSFTMEVDGSAWSGPWHGGDYFKFKAHNQYYNRIYAAANDENSVQDWKCGNVPAGSRCIKSDNELGGVTAEVKIPCNLRSIKGYTCWPGEEPTNCFKCVSGGQLGLLVSYEGIGLDRVDVDDYHPEPWASSFERMDWHVFDLVEADTSFALLSAKPENTELHLGEFEPIDLTFVNYGPTGDADVTIESAGPVYYSGMATITLEGLGATTAVTAAFPIPENEEAAGLTDFNIITSMNGRAVTNTYSWVVVPESTSLAALLLLLALAMKRSR